jgi:hypothetical protein
LRRFVGVGWRQTRVSQPSQARKIPARSATRAAMKEGSNQYQDDPEDAFCRR